LTQDLINFVMLVTFLQGNIQYRRRN